MPWPSRIARARRPRCESLEGRVLLAAALDYIRALEPGRPLFVEELAVDPDLHGHGIGSFVLEQLEHLAKVRGCTHLVLEVAENNDRALKFYRARAFHKLDAAVFMAKRVQAEAELLPPRRLRTRRAKSSHPGGDGK